MVIEVSQGRGEAQVIPEGRQLLLNALERRAESSLTSALENKGVGVADPVKQLYENLSQEGIKKPWGWQFIPLAQHGKVLKRNNVGKYLGESRYNRDCDWNRT